MHVRALLAGLLAVPLLIGVAGLAAAADSTTISAPSVAAKGSSFYIDAGYSLDPLAGGGTFQLLVTLVGAGANGSLALPNSPLPPPEVTNCTPGQSPAGDPRLTCDWTVPDNTPATTALKALATVNSDAPSDTWTAVSQIEFGGNPVVPPAEADVQIVDPDTVTVTAPATAAQGASVTGTVDLFVAPLPGNGDQSVPLSISLVGAGANGSLGVPSSLPAGVTGCAVDTNPAGDPRLTCTYTVPVATGGSATLTIPVGIGSAAPVGSTFVLRAALADVPVTGEAPITITAAASPSPTASPSPSDSAAPPATASPTTGASAATAPTPVPVPTAVPAGAEPAGPGQPVGLYAALAALAAACLVATRRLTHHGQHE